MSASFSFKYAVLVEPASAEERSCSMAEAAKQNPLIAVAEIVGFVREENLKSPIVVDLLQKAEFPAIPHAGWGY